MKKQIESTAKRHTKELIKIIKCYKKEHPEATSQEVAAYRKDVKSMFDDINKATEQLFKASGIRFDSHYIV